MKYKILYNNVGGFNEPWEIELEKRISKLDKNKLNDRNKNLKTFYLKLEKLFIFIQENNIPIFMRHGGLLMTIRHQGFIEKGGLDYFYGYDNDMDVYILDEHRELLLEKFKNSDYEVSQSNTLLTMIKRECDDECLNFYRKRNYLNLNNSSGFYIKEKSSNTKLLDGSYMFYDGNEFINLVLYKYTNKVKKEEYKTYPKYGEYRFAYNEIMPLKKNPFYDSIVNVPNNSKQILKKYYGQNVFKEVFTYIPDSDGGSITKKYNINENILVSRVNFD